MTGHRVSWAYNNMYSDLDTSKLEDITFTSSVISSWDDIKNKMNTSGNNHIFDNVYQKIVCCLGGKSGVSANDKTDLKYYDSEGKLITIKAYGNDCIINGEDFYDDNITKKKYNRNCELFFHHLFAFTRANNLKDDNDFIAKYGACYVRSEIEKHYAEKEKGATEQDPGLMAKLIENRVCLNGNCAGVSGFKPYASRERSCTFTICNAAVNVKDNEVGNKLTIQSKITQNCEANSNQAPDAPVPSEADEPKDKESKDKESNPTPEDKNTDSGTQNNTQTVNVFPPPENNKTDQEDDTPDPKNINEWWTRRTFNEKLIIGVGGAVLIIVLIAALK